MSDPLPTLAQRGRVIRGGSAEGPALVTTVPVSFYGGVDLERGVVVEDGHPLEGQALAGCVLVMPRGKGSTVGSWAMLRLARRGLGPVAVLCARTETIVAVGAILAEIPCVDGLDLAGYRTGDRLRVSDGLVERLAPAADPRGRSSEPDPREPNPREPDPREPDPREPDPREPDPREPDPREPTPQEAT